MRTLMPDKQLIQLFQVKTVFYWGAFHSFMFNDPCSRKRVLMWWFCMWLGARGGSSYSSGVNEVEFTQHLLSLTILWKYYNAGNIPVFYSTSLFMPRRSGKHGRRDDTNPCVHTADEHTHTHTPCGCGFRCCYRLKLHFYFPVAFSKTL